MLVSFRLDEPVSQSQLQDVPLTLRRTAGKFRVIEISGRTYERQRQDPVGMTDRHALADHSTHGDTDNVRAGNA